MIQELVKGYTRKQISPRCMVKVDIQKAYDSVEWIFLEQLLSELGFPWRYIKWIMECVTTVTYSFNVNGEVTVPFAARKGLRQGDSISPYLFVVCMEYLSRCLMSLHENRLYHYHPRCKRLKITHVCFADDLLMFARGDVDSVQQLLRVFGKFGAASGLHANHLKSSIYFGGVKQDVRQEILEISGMCEGNLPFRYLGIPLSTKKISVVQWQPLLQKILAKVTCWTARYLSYAGRLQLIKSVLFGMQTYWCQVFLLPQKVIKLIQTICRVFLWTGQAGMSRRALVAWERVMLPMQARGLNVINMEIWNRAAVCKLLWRLNQQKDQCWIRWIHGYYIKQADIWEMELPKQSTWMVRKILGARECLKQMQDGKCWISNSKFSIKKLYKALIGSTQKVAWAKMLCQNVAPPKCIFMSWLLLHEKLVTCAYLKKRGIQVDEVCCLCKKKEESLDHLFF